MSVVLLAVPVAALALVLALRRRTVITVGVDEHGGVVAIAQHTRRWRVAGLLLGGVGAVLVLVLGERVDALGRLTALAPTLLGTGVLLGTIGGELTARPPVGIRRSASVEARTLGAILPRGRAVLLAVSTALLIGALALGAAWGSADDLGRAGRWLTRQCVTDATAAGGVLTSSGSGPWPGSFYALPLAAALAVLAGLVTLALRAIVARPCPELDSRGLDTLLRRWSVGTVLTAATVTVLGTLGPVALLMASALAGTACTTAIDTVVTVLAAAVGALSTGAAFGLAAGLVTTPTIRVDDRPRPLPGEAAPVGAPQR